MDRNLCTCGKFKKDFLNLCLERGEGRERARERNIDGLPLTCTLTRDQTHNSGMCPESNQRPFALRDDAQTTEPYQLGLHVEILKLRSK